MTLRVDPSSRDGVPCGPEGAPSAFADAGYCGASFNEGLIRFHDAASAGAIRESVMDAFSAEVAGTLDVLACDWMGRQIVTVTGGGDDPVLHVADIGRGQVSAWMRWTQFCAAVQDGSIAGALEEDALTVLRGSLEPAGSMLDFDEASGTPRRSFSAGRRARTTSRSSTWRSTGTSARRSISRFETCQPALQSASEVIARDSHVD